MQGDKTPEIPHLLIDRARTARNIEKMAAIAESSGVALRPHVKTHKIPAIARTQVEAGAAGITVAKVSEAQVMADAGLEDIFIAYPLVSDSKIRRAVELGRRVNLIVGVDSLEGARRLSKAAEDRVLEVRLEVDTGLRRTGVPRDEALELASSIASLENLDLTGIYTYRGYVLEDGSPTFNLKSVGLEEGRIMVSLADRMRERGIGVRDVSLGSTPTAEHAAEVEGVTEIRPGTYVFYDRMQVQLAPARLRSAQRRWFARWSVGRARTWP
jgi:D-serine deaminase-like pyridoxal phosphate-dependent protein